MATPYLGNVPNRATGATTFSADTDYYHSWLSGAITSWNIDIAALNTNDTRDTSVTSILVGSGSKTFTVSAGKSFSKGQWLTIADTVAPTTNSMVAQVSSYSGTSLVVNVPANGVFGGGTIAAWTIALTGAPSNAVSAAMAPVVAAATLPAALVVMGAAPLTSPTFNGIVTAPKFMTSGASQSVASATWVNVIVFASAAPATWLVSFNIGAVGDTANYGTTVLVMTDTAAATRVVLQQGALLTTQMLGLQLQAQQGSGSVQIINATATRIA